MFSRLDFFVCAIFLIASPCIAQQKQQSLQQIFLGPWNLQITNYKLADNKHTSGDDLNLLLNFTEDASKHTAIFNDWEGENFYRITIDWLSINSGEVRIAELKPGIDDSEDQDGEQEFVGKSAEFVQSGKDQLLFSFDFVNRTNAYLFAFGEFNGLNNNLIGIYQIVFPSSYGFIFNIFSKDGTEILAVTGSKQISHVEQSWWQRIMGSPIAMVGLFMVMRMFLTRQNFLGGGGGEATEGRAPATGGAARGRAARTPTVEDVSDKSPPAKKND